MLLVNRQPEPRRWLTKDGTLRTDDFTTTAAETAVAIFLSDYITAAAVRSTV